MGSDLKYDKDKLMKGAQPLPSLYFWEFSLAFIVANC